MNPTTDNMTNNENDEFVYDDEGYDEAFDDDWDTTIETLSPEDTAYCLALVEKSMAIDNLLSIQIDEFKGIPVFLSDNVILKQCTTLNSFALIGYHHSTNMLMITVNNAFLESPDYVRETLLMECYAEYELGLVKKNDDSDDEPRHIADIDNWLIKNGAELVKTLEYLMGFPDIPHRRALYGERLSRANKVLEILNQNSLND